MRGAALLTLSVLTVLAQSPQILSKSEPPYTEEARRAKVNSTVRLSFVIDGHGVPQDIQVERGAGFGLDQTSVQSLSTWRFEPLAEARRTSVEMNFRLLGASHEGQLARLNFTVPPGANRPELISGSMPSNPSDASEARLRVALSVGADGKPRDVSLLETSLTQWANDILREIDNWRFRPASLNGQAIESKGIFELTRRSVGAAGPVTSGTPVRGVRISPSDPADPSLPSPVLTSPPNGAVFDVYPRRTTLQWEASPGAASYIVEWDYSYSGVWHTEAQKTPVFGFPVQGTQFTFDFVGAQPGRWRIYPVSSTGLRGNPSAWGTFSYLR